MIILCMKFCAKKTDYFLESDEGEGTRHIGNPIRETIIQSWQDKFDRLWRRCEKDRCTLSNLTSERKHTITPDLDMPGATFAVWTYHFVNHRPPFPPKINSVVSACPHLAKCQSGHSVILWLYFSRIICNNGKWINERHWYSSYPSIKGFQF